MAWCTQSMAREWRGREIVIYWYGTLRITVREVKEATNGHVAAREMENGNEKVP